MDQELLFERVGRWGGLTRKREAERASAATLRALGEALLTEEANSLAEELPSGLARALRTGVHEHKFGEREFYERVARYERVAQPFAIEHAQAVCQALGSLLSGAAMTRLANAVPDLAPLFEVADRESLGEPVRPPHGHTLADGREGSEHPLSEAHPDPFRPIR